MISNSLLIEVNIFSLAIIILLFLIILTDISIIFFQILQLLHLFAVI